MTKPVESCSQFFLQGRGGRGSLKIRKETLTMIKQSLVLCSVFHVPSINIVQFTQHRRSGGNELRGLFFILSRFQQELNESMNGRGIRRGWLKESILMQDLN
jgi:hypothetical protein